MSVLVLAAAASGASAQHSIDTKAMVLQRSDLPSNFGTVLGRYITNSQLAATSPGKNFRKLGRVSGYYIAYSTIALRGLTVVESFASLYAHDSGARDSLEESIAQTTSGGQQIVPARAALASLGTDARLLHLKMSQGGTSFDYYTVAWRDNRVFAEVRGAGRAGTIAPADVIALAKKQDAHISKLVD
ncbi:MAG TPA: hypothetical protein VFA88_08760 [Gaiellaceae bacterium]|nr:hypothetical protein [Gaiellaceae bacterium]